MPRRTRSTSPTLRARCSCVRAVPQVATVRRSSAVNTWCNSMYSLNFILMNYSRSAYKLYSLPCVYISISQHSAYIHRETVRKSQCAKCQRNRAG